MRIDEKQISIADAISPATADPEAAVTALTWYPNLGRPLADGDTRRLTVTGTPYLAFYRLRGKIDILAILHGAQKWPDRFPE